MGYRLVDRRPGSADDATPALILLCTKYYQNWSMSVEDIANQTSVIFERD